MLQITLLYVCYRSPCCTCVTEHLAVRVLQIIWRRASDPNPLTIGDMVYVSDERYSVQSLPRRLEWNLVIKDVQKRDGGVYECQISSRHKLVHHTMLTVNSMWEGGRVIGREGE